MALGPVGQIHISVTDIDTSVAFYQDVLGIPLLFQVPNMPMAFSPAATCGSILACRRAPSFAARRCSLHRGRYRC
jgi:catechol 2,3-dioxygenase-like lactoylglutathione lyase family enzyme